MKKILIIGAVLIMILMNYKDDNIIIPTSSLRFRVIANSNNIDDQNIKNGIERSLESYLIDLTKTASSAQNAKQIMLDNKSKIEEHIDKYLTENKINQTYKLSIGNNYFPTKKYKGITYNAGHYDSVVLTLGRGNGLNWWCVIYPPLCLLDHQESTPTEYTFFVKELLEKYNI